MSGNNKLEAQVNKVPVSSKLENVRTSTTSLEGGVSGAPKESTVQTKTARHDLSESTTADSKPSEIIDGWSNHPKRKP